MQEQAVELWSFGEVLEKLGPRIFFAILCGGMIGFERELKAKPAGIKTNMLICLGSSLFTYVSILMAATYSEHGHFGDPTRIAAQIVSGIGFLGGGSILQARGAILGLTTAATIWVVAAIGVCIGIGHWELGIVSSLSVILVLVITSLFEDLVLGRALSFSCQLWVEDLTEQAKTLINQALSQYELKLEAFQISFNKSMSHFSLTYRGHRKNHKKFLLALWMIPGIKEVKY